MPPGVVTTTSAGPAVPDGAVTVIDVDESAVTVAAAPPMVTELALARLVPPMTTVAPAVSGPASGITEATIGADW